MKKQKKSRARAISCDLGPLENMILIRDREGRLPDWCTPLTAPVWLSAHDARHMRPEDPVLGLLVEGKPYALPWWMMKNHHVANLTLEGRPILVTLCEVCSGAAAFHPVLDDRRLTFRVEGGFNGTFITTDYETGSLWAPFTGEALHGPLQGARLERLSLYQATWAEWTAFYPTSLVPDGEGESREGHGSDRRPGSLETGGRLFKTLLHRDERLPHNELVLGVESNGQARAYPLTRLHQVGQVLNDSLGGRAIVIFSKPQSWMAVAFSRDLDGDCLEFEVGEDGSIVDRNTRSRWDLSGQASSGPLAGRTLSFVPSGIEEWYTWAASHHNTEIFDGTSPS